MGTYPVLLDSRLTNSKRRHRGFFEHLSDFRCEKVVWIRISNRPNLIVGQLKGDGALGWCCWIRGSVSYLGKLVRLRVLSGGGARKDIANFHSSSTNQSARFAPYPNTSTRTPLVRRSTEDIKAFSRRSSRQPDSTQLRRSYRHRHSERNFRHSHPRRRTIQVGTPIYLSAFRSLVRRCKPSSGTIAETQPSASDLTSPLQEDLEDEAAVVELLLPSRSKVGLSPLCRAVDMDIHTLFTFHGTETSIRGRQGCRQRCYQL